MTELNRKAATSENLEDKFMILWADANDGYSLDFVVLEIEGIEIEPEPGPIFHNADGEETHDVDAAHPIISGFIKWDGCSNWSFHDDDGMMHMCGYRDAMKFARLMPRMYKIARDNMSKFDAVCADMEPT